MCCLKTHSFIKEAVMGARFAQTCKSVVSNDGNFGTHAPPGDR